MQEQCSSNQIDEALRTDHSDALKALNASTLETLRQRRANLRPSHPPLTRIGAVEFAFVEGNITDVDCEAVVNAANETLEGGGGVDHIIHARAGPELRKACIDMFPLKKVTRPGGGLSVGDNARCQVGEAVVTPAFNIRPARFVIHTVAPLLDGEGEPQPLLLALCYQSCLDAAEKCGIKSVAFSSLGTGFYGYPQVVAAQVSIKATVDWVRQRPPRDTCIEKIVFVTYGQQPTEIYRLCFELFEE